ncbi:COG3 protein [Ephemerocybe angulata]|uniref:Conserved oligomeric Golgi complex subunit 3 n=1 Tax=Ephemerocybe angulata TaxID=980116 RepID=A0A8H6HDA2_9AGAR|nr:COG3 protein [Tulosesus angulatus]
MTKRNDGNERYSFTASSSSTTMSSSTRQGARRSQPPSSLSTSTNATTRNSTLTPGAYTALSVEEWESKAPLGDLEIRSVTAVKTASERIPYPLKFTREEVDDDEAGGDENESASSRSATPINVKFALSSRPGTPSLLSPLHRSTPSATRLSALHPRQPVNTTQQLYDWFALIDRSVAHSQESHFRAHVSSVSEYLDTCDLLLARVDEIENEVERMMECWRSVEEGGRSLKDACERVLEERDKLIELTDDIGAHLEYFQELDQATRMLNHPGEQLIYQADFLYMVEKVDICIEFLRARRHYKESEVYLLRFQQCLTRAMTLVRMNFVGSLRALSADISKRLSDSSATLSETAVMHLLYTRFRSVATKVAPLLGELERRAKKYPDELGSLLAECHSAYFSVRKALLVPKVLEEIKGLDPSRSELVELTRTGCSYLKQLCTDEFNLYREFFSTAEDQLYQYLETLCDLLYDDLRPRILHEPRLTALCEVCTVLQALMVLDAPSSSVVTSTLFSTDDSHLLPGSSKDTDSSDDYDDLDDDELNIDFDHPGREKSKDGVVGKRLHTRHLLQMVLQDAQTRLFFKAQSVIQSEIRYYVPKKEDLAWPDVILNANKPRSVTEIREKESISRIFDKDEAGLGAIMKKQETWYPTVRKMVWVLEQLHDFVKPAIFEDIAQEAALLCRHSLFSVADIIKARPPPSTPLDGSLFLVRHLLILKEVARRVGLSTSGNVSESVSGKGNSGMLTPTMGVASVPGGGMTGTLTTMLNRTTSILPEGLFASLGVPRADENLRDVKHGLDDDLRRACEEVITSCVNPLCEPLDEWAMKIHTYSRPGRGNFTAGGRGAPPPTALGTAAGVSGPDAAAWANPGRIKELYDQFRLKCERDLRANAARIRLYLGEQVAADEAGSFDSPGGSGHQGGAAGSSTPSTPNPNSNANQGGGRTARVLIEHVRERVWEGYRGFYEGVKEMSLAAAVGAGQDEMKEREWREVVRGMESESGMREVLRGVCGL